MATSSQRSVELHIGGTCSLRCPLCDCRREPTAPGSVDRSLAEGGGRLLLRGAGEPSPALHDAASRGKETFGEVVVRTSAAPYAEPAAAAALRASGATGVLVPLFSHAPSVHDAIAGAAGTLVNVLRGMRSLAAAGLAVEIEIPLLQSRLQRPGALLDMARRAVPALRAVRFFLPRGGPPFGQLPLSLGPPRWSEVAPSLAAAITACREAKIGVSIRGMDAIPLCALRDHPALHDVYRFNPKARSSVGPDCLIVPACSGCVVRRQCPGVARSYIAAHEAADIQPYRKRPAAMFAQRTGKVRVWSDEERQSAARATLLVLRPTVNCNQDCTFCSANETSRNVWTDPGVMLRQIARAARRGIEVLSFSGGEPTLSRDLPSFIAAARRLGMKWVELVTNGVLLDSERRVKELKDAGLSMAFVSLHAHDEALSRTLTQKVGDFERTKRAIGLLLDHGISTTLNHVVSARNHRFLESFVEMVRREYGGRAVISFSFVTPQYKALEDLGQMPRLGDVMPDLRRAMRRAVALGQPFFVGARQGIPPCFLREFQGWSDILRHAHEAKAEDGHQKVRSPKCDSCRYTRQCTGVWKPYAERYGTDELSPIVGPPFTNEEITDLSSSIQSAGLEFPDSFAMVPEPFRHHDGEAEQLLDTRSLADPAREPVRLPVFELKRSRPVRLALLGGGRQARVLARAARSVRGVSIDAVASPHVNDGDLRDFGSCPAFRDAGAAIAEMRPEGLVIAADTRAHHELARLALASGTPALLERPITLLDTEADDLLAASRESATPLMPAHSLLFAEGLERLGEAGPLRRIAYASRAPAKGPRALRVWSKVAVHDGLYDALTVVLRAARAGLTDIAEVRWTGDSRPERIQARFSAGSAAAEIALDYAASDDELTLTLFDEGEAPILAFRGAGDRHASGDTERMLARFRDVVLGTATPEPPLEEAVLVMHAARRLLGALIDAGAPFGRVDAPKHVASKSLARL